MLLDCLDLLNCRIHGLCHHTMHGHGVVALYEVWLPAASAEEVLNLIVGKTCKHGRIADLIAVHMHNRKNSSVADGIQKLVGMPGSSKGTCLRLPVAYYGNGNQIRIIQNSSKGMSDRISQFTALINGTRRLRRTVAGNAAGEGELLEHLFHSLFILADIWVYFTVGTLQIGVSDLEVSAVSRSGNIDHIQIIALDCTVTMGPDKILSRNSSPVAYDLFLNLIHCQGFAKQRIIQQVELSCGKIVCCPPVSIHLFQHFIT